jgi:hypothetical protein
MTRKEFLEQAEIASKIVSQWPEWKKNILEHSLHPTIKVARTPVDNRVNRGPEAQNNNPVVASELQSNRQD